MTGVLDDLAAKPNLIDYVVASLHFRLVGSEICVFCIPGPKFHAIATAKAQHPQSVWLGTQQLKNDPAQIPC
jgi:hypothetical protein